ncbi:MAG: carboxypeptidase regulatory-like domain-containing protein [Ignavibacteriaceae bacterium]|nr:carboxypeptidase-like regulatory domain-containing protein [Ignavibacteria bacterium]MBT8393162.1 carboxypeptidase-like regulatory domain-containing protein [Ignavibacteria bacterium]NNL21282.1 carboxypeptidase regulatory-like domain-containing protein [Ignavibacteriaceae bacterium]
MNTVFAQEESATNKRMAEMMANMIDEIWDQSPDKGLANIRISMTKDGEPFAGKVSILTDFLFRAEQRGSQSSQGFNPNSNGRWVYEGLQPGTYKLVIEGINDFESWQWNKEGITVSAGDTPLFEISLD